MGQDDGLPALETIPLTQAFATLIIHKARNIEDKGIVGKADPYVVVEFEDKKYRSETVKNNLNPEWNFMTNLEINENMKNPIFIEIFDDDFGKDDALGNLIVDSKALYLKRMEWNNGLLLVIVNQEKFSYLQQLNQKNKDIQNKNVGKIQNINKIGKARITIHRGKKLEKRGIFGKANPYVLLSQKDFSTKSQSVKNTTNPDWNFTRDFDITNQKNDNTIKIQVFDDCNGKDDPIGETIYDLNDLSFSSISNKWIKLDKCKSGQILLSGEIVPLPVVSNKNIDLKEDVKADSNERGAFGLRDKLNDNKESIKESKLNSIENISTQINRENEYIEITEHDSKTNDIYKSEKDLLPKNKEISIFTTENKNTLEAGRLIITVFKARDIEKKGMFGKADPYVHITLGKQKAKSKT